MTATTYPEFGANTEGLEVASAFAGRIVGKTIIVTGVNLNGIGFTTAQALASQSPAHLILAGRNLTKVQECMDALKAQFPNVNYRLLQIHLSIQASVRAAAERVLSWPDIQGIDLLINSAGVAGIQKRTLSPDGIEKHFATNHIGHWLFTCLILPKLIKATEGKPKGSVRVINVSSLSPTNATMRWSDMNFEKQNRDLPEAEQPPYEFFKMWGYTDAENQAYVPLDGYNRSKVANVLFGIGANARWFEKHGILTLAVHPGVIGTDLVRHFPPETMEAIGKMYQTTYKKLGAGSSTSLIAALDPKLGVGESREGMKENYGAFLIDCQISDAACPLAVSSAEAEKLWVVSEELVGEKFS